jgi:hypothetical protein
LQDCVVTKQDFDCAIQDVRDSLGDADYTETVDDVKENEDSIEKNEPEANENSAEADDEPEVKID